MLIKKLIKLSAIAFVGFMAFGTLLSEYMKESTVEAAAACKARAAEQAERIAILQENNAKLETAVALNVAAIDQMQADFASQQTELNRINQEYAETRRQNNVLNAKLATDNLGMLAQTTPDSTERAINNAGRCFEILGGAPLTNQEKEATNGKSFNKECPWLWPGPVDLNQK